jgi:hypothetical protein
MATLQDRFNINSQLEHLQTKYVGTGDGHTLVLMALDALITNIRAILLALLRQLSAFRSLDWYSTLFMGQDAREKTSACLCAVVQFLHAASST